MWFNRATYTVTLNSGENGTAKAERVTQTGSVTASAGGSNTITVKYGDTVKATATPNTGYSLSSWSGGYVSGTTNPVTGAAVTANKTITAAFADTVPPTLTTSTRSATDSDFSDWVLSGSASVNNGTLSISTSSDSAYNYYKAHGVTWDSVYEYNTPSLGTNTSSAIGESFAYYTNDFTNIAVQSGWRSARATTHSNANTWLYSKTENQAATTAYYTKTTLYWRSSTTMPYLIRNFRFTTLEDVYSRSKLIYITTSDEGSGVKQAKYTSGSVTAATCISNGTTIENNKFEITTAGTYTVCVEDNNSNSTATVVTNSKIDRTAPTGTITTTSNLKATSQTATLTCNDSTSGITEYYFGTNSNPAATDFTAVTQATSFSTTATITESGTYYLVCKDYANNKSTSQSKTYYSYTVNNMYQNVTGSTYTTNHYTQASTYTYLAPSGTTLTLTSIYTIPSHSRSGRYNGASVGEASTTAATVSKTNPTLSADTTYSIWFTRNVIYMKIQVQSDETLTNGTGTTYDWSLDSDRYIVRTTESSGATTTTFHSYRYGVTSIDMYNYNGSTNYVIGKTGHTAVSGAEYACVSGCASGVTTISHSAITLTNTDTQLCDTTSADCTIVLKVNWTNATYNIGYSLNNGTYGTNHPTSATYNSTVTINNPTKQVVITGATNSTSGANGTGVTIGTASTLTSTFDGWTANSNLNTSTAYYGTASTAVTTAWTSTSTKAKGPYFKNLRSAAGTVTLTANWSGSVNLPTVTKTGYTCGWNTSSSGTTITYASGASYTPASNSATAVTMYAVCTINSYNLTINPNGGTFNSSTSNTVITQNYNTTYDIPLNATRTGYIFGGWKLTSGTGNITYYSDGEELKSYVINSASASKPSVYNNKSNGNVTHSIISDSTSSTGYSMKIVTSGTASPGAGGFVNSNSSVAGTIYYHKIVAKIPTGYNINYATNNTGVGYGGYWITSQAGTGNWATYIYAQYTGYNTPFSTFGHVYVSGTDDTSVTWYVNESTIYQRGANLSEMQSKKTTFKFLDSDATMTAQWSASGSNITFDKGGGTFGDGTTGTKWTATSKIFRYLTAYTATKQVPHYTSESDFSIYKTGYDFKGWYTSATGGTQVFNTDGQLNASVSGYSDANRKWQKYDTSTTLYAQWTAHGYTVKYASGNSNCTLNTTTYANKSATYDTDINIANPTCSGYEFTGWTASGDIDTSVAKYGTAANPSTAWVDGNKGTYFKNLTTTSGGTVTLTAGFVEKVYEIKNSGGTVTGYANSLTNALTAVTANGTIKALKNNSSAAVTNSKNIKIDLGGKTVTLTGILTNSATLDIYSSANGGTLTANLGRLITNDGTLTVNGTSSSYTTTLVNTSSATGTYVVVSNSGKPITVNAKAELKFANAIVQGDTAGYRYVVSAGGVFTLAGGTITNTASDTLYDRGINVSSAAGRIVVTSGTVNVGGAALLNSSGTGTDTPAISISGGTVSSTKHNTVYNNNATGKVVVSGGSISSVGYSAVLNNKAGLVEITEGTITSTSSYAANNYAAGTMTISGGSLNSSSIAIQNNNAAGVLNISGGTITSTNNIAVRNQNTGTVNVTGGSITGKTAGLSNVAAGTLNVTNANANITATGGPGINGLTGVVTISAGTVTGSTYGLEKTTGSATISGGVVKGATSGIYSNGAGTITVEGGSVSTTGTATTNYGIHNNSTGIINVSGGNITSGSGSGIYNTTTGSVNVTAGTVTGAYGIYINAGTVTMGENDGGTPSITSPKIAGTGTSAYGVYTKSGGTLNFYDGIITSAAGSGHSIYGTPNVPTNYEVQKTVSSGTETAILKKAVTLTVSGYTTATTTTSTFTIKSSVAGTFTISSGSTATATVSPTTQSGVAANTAKTETLTLKAVGNTVITVKFTPTDSSYATKTYTQTIYTKRSNFTYYSGSGTTTSSAYSYCVSTTSSGTCTLIPTTTSAGPTSTGTNCSGTATSNTSSFKGWSSATNTTTTTTTYSSSNANYYAVYEGSWSSYYQKGTGISTIGSTGLNCTNYKYVNGSAYTSSTCNVTLPTITATEGYVSVGWIQGTATALTTTAGTAAGTSVSLDSNKCYTARARNIRADELSYDNTNTGESCDTAQCMIDRLDELLN